MTYLELQTQIASDLTRSLADLQSEIKQAIKDAIFFFQDRRFWFNEVRATANTNYGDGTIAGNESGKWLAVPTNIQSFETLIIKVAGSLYPIEQETHDAIDAVDNGLETGTPARWAYFGNQIRFYPCPDKAYTLTLSYIKTFPELSGNSDSNAWITEAKDLIRARALWDLYMNTIKDYESAAAQKPLIDEQIYALLRKRDTRLTRNKITKYL